MTPRTAHTFDDELARFDGVATADALAAGSLSPVEVVEAAVRRADAVDGELCAVVVTDHDRAIDAARHLERRGGLGGVPTYIKDMVDVEGLPTAWGSPAIAGGPPKRRTLGIATQFRDMGMITLGKSSLSEFGFVSAAEPHHADPTRNPWNLDRATGGSSGGSAALVAAGVVPIAHAADGGGSIRIPASCCGLVGLKSTRGRLLPHPEERIMPVSVVVDGVVTRTVRDTARWFAEAEKLYRNRKLPAMGVVEGPPRRRLRVGAFIDLPPELGIETDAPTRRAFDATIELLESLGHRVSPAPAPVGADFADDFIAYFGMLAYFATVTARLTHGRHVTPDDYSDYTKGMADSFRHHRGRAVQASRRLRHTSERMAELHRNFDVLLTPVTTTIAPELGHLSNHVPHQTLLDRVASFIAYTPLANAAGTPAISLPLGHDPATGVPIGMMFGAAAGEEALLLQLAYELEAAQPWSTVAGGRP